MENTGKSLRNIGNMVPNSNVSWLALKNYKEEEVGGSNI